MSGAAKAVKEMKIELLKKVKFKRNDIKIENPTTNKYEQ